MTYTELRQLLIDYLENDETSFTDNLAQIIQQAETRIYKMVRTPDQRKTVTGSSITSGENSITGPADLREVSYLLVNGNALIQRQKSFIRTVWGSATGEPEDYAIDYDSGAIELIVGPTADATYAYELQYFGNAPSIVDKGETWLSTLFSECLLYGSLIEGYGYNKGDADMMKVYQERFDRSVIALQRSAEDLGLKDEYRNPPVRAEAG